MPGFARFPSLTRALTLAALCAGVSLAAGAQSTPGIASRSTSTLVVVLPAGSDSVRAARVARAVAGRNVVAVYTTDNPAAYHAAAAVHTEFGGSLIPYDRLSRSGSDFADLLFHNAVDRAERRHAGQAVLVVAETDVTLPFLRRATGLQAVGSEPDSTASDGFVIAIEPDGTRSVKRLPF